MNTLNGVSANHAATRVQRGFSFIEILVVMGIISVLVSMVVVVIPTINEKAAQTKSSDNVKSMLTFYMADSAGRANKWPPFSGKNFIMSLVATNKINPHNIEQLQMLFSPGDTEFGFERIDPEYYKGITLATLKQNQDNSQYTSYAGRRNGRGEKSDMRVTPAALQKGEYVITDDDQGPLHHPDGIIVGTLNGSASFKPWHELELPVPEDPDNPEPFLGDDSDNDLLRKISSQ